MKEYKERAEYYRIGLLTGLLHVADVIAWADREVARAEQPIYILIELSLMEGAMPHDICSKLREFPGEVDKFRIIRNVLVDMYSSLKVNSTLGDVFARGLNQLWADCDYEVPEELEPISWLDEQPFMLAEFLERFWKNADNGDLP